MKFRSKTKVAGVALAVASLTALAACSSGSSSGGGNNNNTAGHVTVPGGIGSIPTGGTASGKAATITWAEQPGAVPNWILPIPTSASNSVYNVFTFEWMMWRPLYWTVNGTSAELTPSMSLANTPVYSNGGKTVKITLKGWKWSDGKPITANDILFNIDLIKAGLKAAPSNWTSYVPGQFPDTLVSTSQPDTSTLVLNLKKPVNPSWFTLNFLAQGPIVPLPSHVWAKTSASGPVVTNWTDPAVALKIFNFLTAQSKSVSTYASNPLWQVVDGPYKLSAYNATTGGFTMVPNPSYGGPHATPQSSFQGVPFTSQAAAFNAIKAGSVDVGYIPQNDVPQLPQLARSGYAYFGMPDFGMTFAAYNYLDKTGNFGSIAKQLYFRQAMAHLTDQQGIIAAVDHGAGAPAYGPIPAYPKSPYLPSNAATNPYPFSVQTAISLLQKNGWTVNQGGTDVCSKPGTGAGQCGAGIPAGTKLSFNLIYRAESSTVPGIVTDLASQAKKAGINITLQSSNFNYIISNYIDPAAPANVNKWAMVDWGGETNNPYATTFSLFSTNGSNQIGEYSNPQADQLINASISGGDPAAVKQEAAFLTTDQPVLFQPNRDEVWAWKTNVSATQPQAIENLTQFYATPEFWYLTK
jgi:peptide/nickel transport system substrate-binding protein